MRSPPLSPVSVLMSMATKSNLLSTMDGLMMILSPAKTLNLKTPSPSPVDIIETTDPSCNYDKTKQLATLLKEKSKTDLKDLLQVSDSIATNVFKYYETFEIDSGKRNQDEKIPASFAFDGPAYKALDTKSCTPQTLHYLQANLRIIDPLYGLLRPMDVIQPYRLEMATKGILKDIQKESSDKHNSLANWWSKSVNDVIAKDLNKKKNGKYLINLASDEYAAAIDLELLPKDTNYIKVAFQQEGKVIAVHAKRARGLMVRYIAENQITDLDNVKKFDFDGYSFVKERSDETTFVFDRPKAETGKKRKASEDAPPKQEKRRGKR